MDTEKILKNFNRVTPFFQPIFSADQHQVIGYEILGRYEEQSEYKSLGPFFSRFCSAGRVSGGSG
ncbi:hypothetical protein RCO48_29655 [Peribacillus frigoritolerans]|nr:hypothetical protein [Peribacillus frigoritolerans]